MQSAGFSVTRRTMALVAVLTFSPINCPLPDIPLGLDHVRVDGCGAEVCECGFRAELCEGGYRAEVCEGGLRAEVCEGGYRAEVLE